MSFGSKYSGATIGKMGVDAPTIEIANGLVSDAETAAEQAFEQHLKAKGYEGWLSLDGEFYND